MNKGELKVQSLVPGSPTELKVSNKINPLSWANGPKTAKPRKDMDESAMKSEGRSNSEIREKKQNPLQTWGREQREWNSSRCALGAPLPRGPSAGSVRGCVPHSSMKRRKRSAEGAPGLAGRVMRDLCFSSSPSRVARCPRKRRAVSWWARACLRIVYGCSFLTCQEWNLRWGACHVVTHSSIFSPALTHVMRSMGVNSGINSEGRRESIGQGEGWGHTRVTASISAAPQAQETAILKK